MRLQILAFVDVEVSILRSRTMLRVMRPWHFFLAFTAVVGVVAVVRASRPAPPPSLASVEVIGPAPEFLRLERRMVVKSQIGEEAAAGRLSLIEAASALKRLDASGSPYSLEAITNCVPGVTLDEGYCRMAIGFTRSAVSLDQADYVAGPFERELDARLKDGTLHLPD
jgi:hypothetical protein